MIPADPRFPFDPVAAFLQRPLDQVVRHNPPSLDTDHSIDGLRTLARSYAWASVLQLSAQLEEHATTLPHLRLLCTAYRALALLQTRQHDRAARIISDLGPLHPPSNDHLYQTYPTLYPSQTGSFVPFELRLLDVEIRARNDPSAIHDAYRLKRECMLRAAQPSPMQPEWRLREALLLSCISSYHLKHLQHDAAVDVARELLVHQGRCASALYLYARVLLHVGDFEGADVALGEAGEKEDASEVMKDLHAGMVFTARGMFDEALLRFDAVLDRQVEGEESKVWMVQASNNAAICLMHCGRLAEAIDRLEGSLRRSPHISLDEGLVFNLSTLYDLAYPDSCTEKKRVLQKLASRFGRQGFNLDRVNLA